MSDEKSPFDDLPDEEPPVETGSTPLVDLTGDGIRPVSFAAEPRPSQRPSQRGGALAAEQLDAGSRDAGSLEGDSLDGGQALISPEESEAIIAAMRAGSLRPEPAPPISPAYVPPAAAPLREAKRTDLGAPEAPLRRALDRADRAARELADVVLDQLLSQVSVLAGASLLESEVLSVDAALEPYVATSTAWDVTFEGGAPRATVILGGMLAEAVLSRRLGAADGVSKPGARAHHPSPLGRRVLEPFAKGCLESVARAMFGGSAGLTMVPAGSTQAKLAGFSPCLKLGTRVRFADVEDDVVVVFYEEALVTRARTASRRPEDDWREVLQDVDVEIVATLGQAHLSVRDFMALKVGSVLRLDGSPERPVSLAVDGTVVLSGMPVVHEGNLAIELVERDVRMTPAPAAPIETKRAVARDERDAPPRDASKNRSGMEVRT